MERETESIQYLEGTVEIFTMIRILKDFGLYVAE